MSNCRPGPPSGSFCATTVLFSICACLFIVGHLSFLLGCKLPKCWGARMCPPTLQLLHLQHKGKDLFFSKIIPRERVSPAFYNTQKPTKQEVMLLKASLVTRKANTMESWSCSLLKVGSRLKTRLAGKSSRGLFRSAWEGWWSMGDPKG